MQHVAHQLGLSMGQPLRATTRDQQRQTAGTCQAGCGEHAIDRALMQTLALRLGTAVSHRPTAQHHDRPRTLAALTGCADHARSQWLLIFFQDIGERVRRGANRADPGEGHAGHRKGTAQLRPALHPPQAHCGQQQRRHGRHDERAHHRLQFVGIQNERLLAKRNSVAARLRGPVGHPGGFRALPSAGPAV